MTSHVLHTVLCCISGAAAGDIWYWSLLGEKGTGPSCFTSHAGPVHLAHSCELLTQRTEHGMANRASPEYTPWRRIPFQVWKRLHSTAGAWALEPRTPDRERTEVWTPWQSCTRDAQLAKTDHFSHGYLIVLGEEGWGRRGMGGGRRGEEYSNIFHFR